MRMSQLSQLNSVMPMSAQLSMPTVRSSLPSSLGAAALPALVLVSPFCACADMVPAACCQITCMKEHMGNRTKRNACMLR